MYYNQFSTVSLAGHSAEQHSRFCFFTRKTRVRDVCTIVKCLKNGSGIAPSARGRPRSVEARCVLCSGASPFCEFAFHNLQVSAGWTHETQYWSHDSRVGPQLRRHKVPSPASGSRAHLDSCLAPPGPARKRRQRSSVRATSGHFLNEAAALSDALRALITAQPTLVRAKELL